MTDKEIIRKAVDKASKNGYKGWKVFVPAFPSPKIKTKQKLEELIGATLFLHKEKIIFSHDFAKAFWGEDLGYCCIRSDHGKCEGWHKAEAENHRFPRWIFHLQQMVLEKEPLKYLEKFL